MATTPPRLYALVAARAPVAAVFRRGPSGWWHVGRWDLVSGDYAPGAWLHGGLYPRRCDLSPDGSLLLAFVMKRTVPGFLEPDPPAWPDTYFTVSKLPWLTALAGWRAPNAQGPGACFVEGPPANRPFALGDPDAGDATPLRRRYGLERHPAGPYAAELLRGWTEDAASDRRAAILVKPRPDGRGRLVLRDTGTALESAVEFRAPAYSLELSHRLVQLEDAAWADWDPQGRLLVATRSGRLELRDPDDRGLAVVRAHDLSALRPLPRPAPEWAQRW
jgi:hypothetical protein